MDVLESIKVFFSVASLCNFQLIISIPLPFRALEFDKEKREILKLNLK